MRAAIERLLVELFLEAHANPPKQIVLDLDATDPSRSPGRPLLSRYGVMGRTSSGSLRSKVSPGHPLSIADQTSEWGANPRDCVGLCRASQPRPVSTARLATDSMPRPSQELRANAAKPPRAVSS